jgi:3-hydroxybutyryl-CoA dehydrogenase
VTIATLSSNLYDDTTAVRVTILGAGLMGAQIGAEYALGGHEVTLVARDATRVEERAAAAFRLVEAHGLAGDAAVADARARTAVATVPDGLARPCDVVVESVPEQLELKADLLRAVAASSPDAILASNTSSIPITELGAAVGAPTRVVGTHYLSPPLLMPPVEVVAGAETDDDLVETVTQLLEELGKRPVRVRRDVPGFVWNRLQFALLRECAWLVDNGVADVGDVDRVVRDGLARRWRRVGPFASIGLGGVETWNRAAGNVVPELGDADELGDLARFVDADAEARERLLAERDEALSRELRDERG